MRKIRFRMSIFSLFFFHLAGVMDVVMTEQNSCCPFVLFYGCCNDWKKMILVFCSRL